MQAVILIRLSSKLLSSIMGGMAVFCLFYAAHLPDFNAAWHLFMDALKWGGCATAIVYFQGKYLDQM
jgi:hypothetical protein